MKLKDVMNEVRRAATPQRAALPLDLAPVREAAAAFQINPFTVWKLIRQGKLRAYGRAGSIRVSLADLMPEYAPHKRPRKPTGENA